MKDEPTNDLKSMTLRFKRYNDVLECKQSFRKRDPNVSAAELNANLREWRESFQRTLKQKRA